MSKGTPSVETIEDCEVVEVVRNLYYNAIVDKATASGSTADVCELVLRAVEQTSGTEVLNLRVTFFEHTDPESVSAIATSGAIAAAVLLGIVDADSLSGRHVRSGKHPRYSNKQHSQNTVFNCLADIVLVNAALSCTGVVDGFRFLDILSLTKLSPSGQNQLPSQEVLLQLCDWLSPEDSNTVFSSTTLVQDDINKSPDELKLTFGCFALLPSWLTAVVIISMRCPEHASVRACVEGIIANGMLLSVLRNNADVPTVVYSSLLKVCLYDADMRLLTMFCRTLACHADPVTVSLVMSPVADMMIEAVYNLGGGDGCCSSSHSRLLSSNMLPLEGIDLCQHLSRLVCAFSASSLEVIIPGFLEGCVRVLFVEIKSNYKQYFSLLTSVSILLSASLTHAYHFQNLMESEQPLHSPCSVLFKPFISARDIAKSSPIEVTKLLHALFIKMTDDHKEAVLGRCE